MEKIVFIYESNHPIVVKDGLWTALDVLETTFEIERINIANQTIIPNKEDFVLGWGAFGSRVDILCRSLKNKKGLCIGGCTPPINQCDYDVLFYETKWYRDNYLKFHPNIVHAFGYNSNVYHNMKLKRDIDYLGVGAFATWKRWERMLDKKGVRRVVGEFQRNNPTESQEIWDTLENGGVLCKDMVTPEMLNIEYNRTTTVYIPANIMGGGERAILEARACGCSVICEGDNPKLKELLDCPLYNIDYYTKQLKEGICGLL